MRFSAAPFLHKHVGSQLDRLPYEVGTNSQKQVQKDKQQDGKGKLPLCPEPDPVCHVDRCVYGKYSVQKINGIQHRADGQGDHGGPELKGRGLQSGQGEINLGGKSGKEGDSDHRESPRTETDTGDDVPVAGALQIRKQLAVSRYFRQPPGRDKQQGFGGRMGDDVEEGGENTSLRVQSDAHVDIADLCHRGKRDHPPYIHLVDGADRPQDHAEDRKDEQDIFYVIVHDDVQSDHTVEYLNQQKNVALGYQAGENGAGSRRTVAVGIRKPGMKGKQR